MEKSKKKKIYKKIDVVKFYKSIVDQQADIQGLNFRSMRQAKEESLPTRKTWP